MSPPQPDPDQPDIESVPYEPLTPYRLFIGPHGLRAGWCAVLFLVIRYLLLGCAHRLFVYTHPVPPVERAGPYIATPGVTLWMETASLLAALIAAWVMTVIERRRFADYGLATRRWLPGLLAGLVTGLAAISLLVGGLWAGHLLIFDGVVLHGQPATIYGLKWAVTFLMVGAYEEFWTRGYLQATLGRGIASLVRTFSPGNRQAEDTGFWITAICLSGFYFMGLHLANGGETAVGIAAVGVAGLVFAFSLWRTGALWWAIGFHAAWDWAQSYLYGVADSGGMVAGHLLASHPAGPAWLSGGTDGPEGSIFVIPTLLLAGVAIHFGLAPGLKRQPDTGQSIYTQP